MGYVQNYPIPIKLLVLSFVHRCLSYKTSFEHLILFLWLLYVFIYLGVKLMILWHENCSD